MKLTFIIVVLSASVWCASGDVSHLRSIASRLTKKALGRHHKRGAFTAIPTYKLGHDIPVVSHSLLKPLVVSYPPSAVPLAVKVPFDNPLLGKYPVPVGSRVPVPHPHYGLRFPHFLKTLLLPKPDQHFHHHHHHVPAKPAVAVIHSHNSDSVVPVPQPTVSVVQPLPAPDPAPVFEAAPLASPVHLSPTVVPFASQPTAPYIPFAPQNPYVIRPGSSIQSSIFSTYPNYPLSGYPTSYIPFASPAVPLSQGYLEPSQAPHYHFLPQQATGHPFAEHQSVSVHQADGVGPLVAQHSLHPNEQHLHVEQGDWAPLPAPTPAVATALEVHPHEAHHYHQEQGVQAYEHQTNKEQFHEYQHQLHSQLERLNNHLHLSQGQPSQEYGPASQEYGPPNQEYGSPNQFNSEYGIQQQINDEYRLQQQQNGEYGLPQQYEGGNEGHARTSEDEEDQPQRYHNHIPLGLQPPIDRPLEHFR